MTGLLTPAGVTGGADDFEELLGLRAGTEVLLAISPGRRGLVAEQVSPFRRRLPAAERVDEPEHEKRRLPETALSRILLACGPLQKYDVRQPRGHRLHIHHYPRSLRRCANFGCDMSRVNTGNRCASGSLTMRFRPPIHASRGGCLLRRSGR